MRISDWSSDVCSSDLSSSMSSRWKRAVGALPIATSAPPRCGRQSSSAAADRVLDMRAASAGTCGSFSVQKIGLAAGRRFRVMPSDTMRASQRIGAPARSAAMAARAKEGEKRIWEARRSEEHTSELQSLMRNSYAVFCLKKKTKRKEQD